MKTLPVDFIRQLKLDARTITYFFELALKPTHTYYWTAYNQSLFYNANWYEAKGITFETVQNTLLTRADSMTLNVSNVDRKFSDLILANEIRGKAVTVKEAVLDRNNAVIDAITIFYGFVDSMEINQKRASIEVFNHMIQWKKMTPRRIHSATCPWVFKDVASQVIGTDAANYTCIIDHPADATNKPTTGAYYATYWTAAGALGVAWATGTQYSPGTCNYIGAGAWCDQSWERCLALTNTAHFGGFRWLPFLVNRDLWWGRNPVKPGNK